MTSVRHDHPWAGPRVSAVVCVYTEDRWDWIVEAVASLRRQTAPPYEIIVVVDHNPALLQRCGTTSTAT